MSRAYLCVSVDTESDKGKGWRARRPLSFEGISDGVVKRLHPLFARFRAKPTYLLSPEIIRDEACVATFRKLAPSCELGTHLHGEYAEPGAYEPDTTRELQRDYPPEIERQKLRYLTDLFIRAFDHQPQSFRAGGFGIGAATIGILESLGYTVESSVTPHMNEFQGSPTQPYHPDPSAPASVGSASILEVPITIRRRFVHAIPGIGSRIDLRWLRPTRGSEKSIVRVAEEEIAEARRIAPRRPVILNAMFHNVEVASASSPYGANDEEARRILDRLRALLDFAQRHAIPVVGLGDVPEILN